MHTFFELVALAVAAVLGGLVVWLWAVRRQGDPGGARLAAFLDHGPFMAFMKDADGRYVFENRAVVEHVGRVRPGTTTLLGRRDHEVFGPVEEQSYVGNDRQVVEGGRTMQFDEISVDADGTIRDWATVKFPWIDAQGRRCPAGISVDVSALRQARSEARSNEDRYRLALDAGRMGTFSLDLASQIIETSPLFAILHGRPETKTRLGLQESLAEVHPDDHPMIAAAVQSAVVDRAPNRIAYRVVLPGGNIRWIELVGQVFGDAKDRPIGVRGVGFDVTDARSGYEELT
ncbi:MAG: PAS domain-containing protein, partial [Planctomycetia bacterium]